MSDACSALSPTGFVSAMTRYIDCQAQTLGSSGWQALATPGSALMMVLTGFLTIFIAIIGYNLLLGSTLTVRSGTLAFVKIGAIFTLATSWPAYRTLVYDLVVDAPGQIVSEIGTRARVVGSDGTLLQRLDGADQALNQLAVLGAGNPSGQQADNLPPPSFIGFDAFALGGSRILFLLSAVAGLGAVRIVTGLMLALGPFFIAFLMFDNTRSLFEGWIRVLAGAAFAAIGISLTLGLELSVIEPWLSQVLAERMGGQALPGMPAELFVLVTLFAILSVVALIACARVARGFRLAQLFAPTFVAEREPATAARLEPVFAQGGRTELEIERSRAAAVANVLVSMNRREAALAAGSGVSQSLFIGSGPGEGGGRSAAPSSSSFSPARRTFSRVSSGARRRDGAA